MCVKDSAGVRFSHDAWSQSKSSPSSSVTAVSTCRGVWVLRNSSCRSTLIRGGSLLRAHPHGMHVRSLTLDGSPIVFSGWSSLVMVYFCNYMFIQIGKTIFRVTLLLFLYGAVGILDLDELQWVGPSVLVGEHFCHHRRHD